ncbi:hypothetical protein BaRGS_00037117 [Batillaria attramentaria]|uniref:Uncharacterized protein n=1 Tax=Batillaria attramentaria TaxID=370345 RepID=A0ABD0J9L2_9CAEN
MYTCAEDLFSETSLKTLTPKLAIQTEPTITNGSQHVGLIRKMSSRTAEATKLLTKPRIIDNEWQVLESQTVLFPSFKFKSLDSRMTVLTWTPGLSSLRV